MTSSVDECVKRSFGSVVRLHRLEQNLSQEKLAELADIHRTYIGDVERGKRNIALLNMVRLARALQLPLSSLLIEMEKEEQPSE